MGSKKTTTTSKETAVTTPNTPGYIQAPVNDYYAGVSNFLKQPANSLVTPTNALQNSVYAKAANLGSNGAGYGTALGAVGGLLGSTSPLAQAPAAINPAQATTGTLANAPTAGTTNATTTNAATTNAGMSTLGAPTNATAASAGKAATVGLLGYDPTTAGSQGYSASLLGNTSGLLPTGVERVNGASLLDGLDKYTNPATQALVDATMAQYDNNAGIARAQMQRQAAGSGAFGGSRYGIAQGQFEADTGRNRALTDAELRAAAFDRATSLSGQDADRRQGAATTNANAQNTLDLSRGQMRMQGLLADQTASNDASRFGADAANTAGMFNATAANDAGQFTASERNKGLLFNADANNTFALSDADRRQQAGLLNTETANDFAKTRYGAENENALFNAGEANKASLFNAGAANDASRFNAGEANTTSRANADRASQYDLARYGAENENSRFNTGQANDIASMMYGTNADLSKFNANLGLDDRRLGLDAASRYADILGNQSAEDRANLAAQLGIGDSQWGYDNQLTQAELQKLLAAGGLLDPQMMAALTGQTITSDGTNTSKQSGGLLNSLLSAGASLGSAAIMASERRVKRDIALVGREPDGLGVYDFRYVWDRDDAPLRRGTMVDEVERLRPWALGPIVDGVQTVNYGAL